MPQSFLPFKTRSLVHLMRGRTPAVRSTARLTATAAMPVAESRASAGTRGRRSTLRYTPRPAGDWKVRPTRPRPAVWAEAAATVRSGAPKRASRLR